MKNFHTEREHFQFNQSLIYSLTALYRRNQTEFYNFSSYLPSYLFLNDKHELNYKFANPVSLNALEVDSCEVMTLDKIKNISDLNILQIAMKKIRKFDQIADLNSICSTLQRVKFHKNFNWIIGNKMILDDRTYINTFYDIRELFSMGDKMLKILEPITDNLTNWQRFNSLSKREKELLFMFSKGMTNKQVADILCISDHTVRTHREQIRRKINVSNLYELIKFTEAFDMVGAFAKI